MGRSNQLHWSDGKSWREANPELKGNVRDYANIAQLVCLSNLENLNALFIHEGLEQPDRLQKLNAIAIQQMKLLIGDEGVQRLHQSEPGGT